MDANRFDAFTRALTKLQSRRTTVSALPFSLISLGVFTAVDAKKGGGDKKKKKKKKKKRDTECARTCDGCCTPENECVPAANQNFRACGRGGVDCVACNDQVECVRESGMCTCTRNSCFGCCSADLQTCLKGNETTDCGKDGDYCQNCAIHGGTCTAQQTCSTCAKAGTYCTAASQCCNGLPCTRNKCAQPAGGPCSSDVECVGELYLQYCRNGRCCAVTFGYCDSPADCCDASQPCSGSSCGL